MSTKPGVTRKPLASISSAPLPDILPTVVILPSFTATSASCRAAPVPSARVPPRTTRSNSVAMFVSPGLAGVYFKATRRGMFPIRMADYLTSQAGRKYYNFANVRGSNAIRDHEQGPGNDSQGRSGPSPAQARRSGQVLHSSEWQRRPAAKASRVGSPRYAQDAAAAAGLDRRNARS